MKFIILLRGITLASGKSVGGSNPNQMFKWSDDHKGFIWQGREIEPEEFNRVIDIVMDMNTNTIWPLPPTVRAIQTPPPAKVKVKTDPMAKARAALAAKRATKPLMVPVIIPENKDSTASSDGVHA